MNRNKEMIWRACVLLGLCSAIGLSSTLHNENYNEDKLRCEEKIETSKSINQKNFDRFIKIAKDSKIKMNKEQQAKEQQLLFKNQKLKDNKSLSRGGSEEYDMTFELTFYTGLKRENSELGAIGSRNNKLFDGCVSNNVLNYGTKIKLQGWGYVEVLDCGSDEFDSPHRLDIFVPRIDGESDRQYYRRVQSMGRVKVLGKIIE